MVRMICTADPAFEKGDGIDNLSRSFPSTTLSKSPLFVQFQAIQALYSIRTVIDSPHIIPVERRLNNRQAISHLLDFTDRYFPL